MNALEGGAVFGDIMQPVDLVVTDEEQFRRCDDTPNTLALEAATGGLCMCAHGEPILTREME